jgi:hypothetical protein
MVEILNYKKATITKSNTTVTNFNVPLQGHRIYTLNWLMNTFNTVMYSYEAENIS